MKKYIAAVLSIFIIFVVFFGKPNPNRTRETYLKFLSKEKFYEKLKNQPAWMKNQIEDDLSFAKENKITQKALKETYEAMKKKFPETKRDFLRYRIIDNQLHHFFPFGEAVTKKEEALERALKTLLKLKKMPDLDFVVSNIDGLPAKENLNNVLFYHEDRRGFYLVDDKSLQAPVFTRAKDKSVKEGILVPDYYALSELWPKMEKEILCLNDQSLWKQKKEVAFWRGASSKALRFNLCEMSLKYNDLIDAGFVEDVNERKIKELKDWKKYDSYNSLRKPRASFWEQLEYKYLPVLDGVMCTYPGYQWRLLSNCTVLKQDSGEVQWFYSALKPYEHYVPLKEDMSDMLDRIKWAKENDPLCENIAKKATLFVLNNLTIEDGYVYLYEVLRSYAKYQNFNKNDLKKDIDSDPRWISVSNRRKANIILKKRGYVFF